MTSPGPLADDLRSLDDRDFPSRTDTLGAALAGTIGGPVGRHALIGRTRFMTPLRVMLVIALVFLALGYSTKAACLQTTGTGTADQRVGNWANNRAYYELCYSDTVPLYTAELLNLGKFPYKSSWLETDEKGKPRLQYDGAPAVRYMEYPVLTGIYQYLSMSLAKTYTTLTKLTSVPIIAEVVMFFNISAFGLALAWLTTVWATALLAGARRIWDAALVAASPIVVFQIFTNFDALATGLAAGAMLAWARRRPVLAGVLIGLGVAAKLYPLLLLIPLTLLAVRTGRLREVGKTALTAAVTWLVVNLPIMVLFPRGWSEFFRLNTRRGDDMDSIYNVVKSFTGWRGFDPELGFWEPPVVLNSITAALFAACCIAIGYIALTASRRPRMAQLAFLVVAAFLLTNKVWSPQFSLWLVPLAVLALPHRRVLLAWMTIDMLVWVPRMLYLFGEQNRGLPEQWFTATVLLRDIAVVVLCALVIRQIYRPELDVVRRGGVDDPAGGVFDRTPDAYPAWLPDWLRPRASHPGPARQRETVEAVGREAQRGEHKQRVPGIGGAEGLHGGVQSGRLGRIGPDGGDDHQDAGQRVDDTLGDVAVHPEHDHQPPARDGQVVDESS
ncbi:putative membrane protein [Mycobacterium sp. BK558]|nr:putative membrane protein [Mycobacterium sp. BK558]